MKNGIRKIALIQITITFENSESGIVLTLRSVGRHFAIKREKKGIDNRKYLPFIWSGIFSNCIR